MTRCVDCQYLMDCSKSTTNPYNYCEDFKKRDKMTKMVDKMIEEE